MNIGNKFSNPINPQKVPVKKFIAFSLMLVIGIIFLLIGNSNQSKINSAIKEVKDLYVSDAKVIEGKSSKIKDSTDQLKIDNARKAIRKINTKDGKRIDSLATVIGLNASILDAQKQLNEREGLDTEQFTEPKNIQEENSVHFQPEDDDVIWKDDELLNEDLMEDFMNIAGDNGKSNDIEIRAVRDFGENGVLIFNIKSVYADYADQGWVEVTADYSHYTPSSDSDYLDVFVKRPQQCSHISKNIELGYYVFNECYTDLEYPFLPFRSEDLD